VRTSPGYHRVRAGPGVGAQQASQHLTDRIVLPIPSPCASTREAAVPEQPRPRQFRTPAALGYFIFASRWLQAPLYVGLIVAQVVYVVVFMVDLWHLVETVFHDITQLNEAAIMLAVLGLIDVVMIANLLIMVIMGGYEIFVSRLRVDDHPDQPDWLNHVNANVLKVKLAISIISISSIHLLRTFIEVGDLGDSGHSVTGETYTSEGVMWQVIIHMAFIVSAIALAWIDRMSAKHSVPNPSDVPLPATAKQA
jgi:uncharacterized protein (TIGR00645 family)